MSNSKTPAVPRLTAAGFERLMREVLAPDAEEFHVTVESWEEGRVRQRLTFHPRQLRPGNTISGPTMFTLADTALYAMTLSVIGAAPQAVTSDLAIRFLRRPPARDLIADARLLRRGRRLVIGEVMLYSDGDEQPVAHATGSYVPPLPGPSRAPSSSSDPSSPGESLIVEPSQDPSSPSSIVSATVTFDRFNPGGTDFRMTVSPPVSPVTVDNATRTIRCPGSKTEAIVYDMTFVLGDDWTFDNVALKWGAQCNSDIAPAVIAPVIVRVDPSDAARCTFDDTIATGTSGSFEFCLDITHPVHGSAQPDPTLLNEPPPSDD
ncbi:MAG: PaaI family thioesterase [Acidobacteriota bacterium]